MSLSLLLLLLYYYYFYNYYYYIIIIIIYYLNTELSHSLSIYKPTTTIKPIYVRVVDNLSSGNYHNLIQ